MKHTRRGIKKLAIGLPLGLILLYAVLLIPSSEPEPARPGEANPFLWNQDDYWSYLESRFVWARDLDSSMLADSIDTGIDRIESILDTIGSIIVAPSSPSLTNLEKSLFELGPLIAAHPFRLPELTDIHKKIRTIIKNQSRTWDMNSGEARDQLYRLLYGARIAVEEVILQADSAFVPALAMARDEPSATPSALMMGVTVHSGDILVSRGGAPTSALIARGNDYPGNFSHVALAYVDPHSKEISIIESHIEMGVAIATVDDYFRDKKLRVLILRLRSDLPDIKADPMIPHKAAAFAFERARNEHIPYDFEMDFKDGKKLFCSEVASNPYSRLGIKLWMGISRISSPGIRAWLAAFGVRNFETQEPSDLEYDPQLTVVAEWHDPETLLKDHLDNAVIDVMLEDAENGERLTYNWFMLPIGRLAKAYSWLKNRFGGIGPVPEGMNAAAALKNDYFSKRHDAIKELTRLKAREYREKMDYNPPYWELVKLARKAKAEIG